MQHIDRAIASIGQAQQIVQSIYNQTALDTQQRALEMMEKAVNRTIVEREEAVSILRHLTHHWYENRIDDTQADRVVLARAYAFLKDHGG